MVSMQINVENLSSVKFRVTISVEAARVQESRTKQYSTLRRQVQIRGFRPGKAPLSLLERHYSESVNEQIKADFLQEGLEKAIDENHLKVIARPEIESSAFDEDGSFRAQATFEVSPAIEPKDYKGLAIRRRKIAVEDKAVQERLEYMARMRSSMKTIDEDRPVADKDIVEIDFTGTKDGVEFPGGKAEKQLLEIGAKSFVPGFEEGLLGMKSGEEKDLNLRFPEDYPNKDLAGADVVFHLKLHAIKQRVIPTLDDEFAKDVDPKNASLEDLRAAQRVYLEEESKGAAREFDRGEVVKSLLEKNDFDIPESMVANQTNFLVERMRRQMTYSGLNRQDVEAVMEGANERLRPEAIRDVKSMLLFEAIADKESLAATDEDVQAKYEELATRFHRSKYEIAAEYQKEDRVDELKFGIRQDKAIDFIIENAGETTWVGPEEEQAELDAAKEAEETKE
jgi:trigger factor